MPPKTMMLGLIEGSRAYSIADDAVIVRIKVPCRNSPSHEVEEAADRGIQAFAGEILMHFLSLEAPHREQAPPPDSL